MSNPLVDRAVKKGLEWADKKQPKQTGRAGQNPYAEGSRYYDMWESNPWTEEKMTQQQTGWDRLANFFGFRSAYDTAVDQRAQAAAEYDAQIVQLQGEDKYNDPAAQAARLQNAGINPALAGGVEGSSAAEFAQEATAPEVTPDENLTRIGTLMNGIAQAITMASGMVDTSIGTALQMEQLEGAKLGNYSTLERMADEWFKNWIPDFNKHNMKDKPEHLTDEQYMESIVMDAAHTWAANMGMSKNKQRDFHNAIQYRLWGNKSVMFDKWHANEESRRKWGRDAGSGYRTWESDDLEGIITAMEPITKLYDSYTQADMNAKSEGAWNDAEYNRDFNAADAAEADNADNRARKQREELDKNMNKAKAEMMKKLTEEAEKGNKWAFFLSLILPVLFNRLEGAQVQGGTKTDSQGRQSSQTNWAF